MQLALGAFVSMEGDGETMYFILYLRQDLEQFAFDVQADGLRGKPVEEFVGTVAVVFGKAGDGDVQVELVLDDRSYDLHLPFSAVGDDEVGEGSALFLHPAVASSYDFLHGGIVIRTGYGLDVVLAVVFPGGFHALVDDAPCDCIRS